MAAACRKNGRHLDLGLGECGIEKVDQCQPGVLGDRPVPAVVDANMDGHLVDGRERSACPKPGHEVVDSQARYRQVLGGDGVAGQGLFTDVSGDGIADEEGIDTWTDGHGLELVQRCRFDDIGPTWWPLPVVFAGRSL